MLLVFQHIKGINKKALKIRQSTPDECFISFNKFPKIIFKRLRY